MMERESCLFYTRFYFFTMLLEGPCGWYGVLMPLLTRRPENAVTKLTLPYCAGPPGGFWGVTLPWPYTQEINLSAVPYCIGIHVRLGSVTVLMDA